MRKGLLALVTAFAVAFASVGAAILALSETAGAALQAADGAGRSVSVGRSAAFRAPAGPSTSELEIAEPAGVIRLFRVVAPAGARVKVSAVITGLAGVSTEVPSLPHDPAQKCRRHGRSVVCTQAEEACPMPAATWVFRVRKLGGPAGRIRIEFVVGAAY